MASFKRGYFKKVYDTLQELRDELVTGELKGLAVPLKFHILQNCVHDGKFSYIDEHKELSIRVKKDDKSIPQTWL